MLLLSYGAACFGAFFGLAMLGVLLHHKLPEHHSQAESHEVVRAVSGLLVAVAAVMLAFLAANTQAAFSQAEGVARSYAADLVILDDMLRDFGPDAAPGRASLQELTAQVLRTAWPARGEATLSSPAVEAAMRQMSRQVLALDGPDHFHRTLATQLASELRAVAMRRVQLIELGGSTVPTLFLLLTAFWLAIGFGGLGFKAPCNALVVSLLLAGSLSVAAAMVLVVDLGTPFGGLTRVSDAPIQAALLHMRS